MRPMSSVWLAAMHELLAPQETPLSMFCPALLLLGVDRKLQARAVPDLPQRVSEPQEAELVVVADSRARAR